MANGRKNKNFIPHIVAGEEVITDQQRKEEVFADYFENLLGTGHVQEHTLDLDFLELETLNLHELEANFTEE